MPHTRCVLFAIAAAASTASAQAPEARKVGADAIMIEFVGRDASAGAAGAVDTTTLLAGRDELRRFVLRAHAIQPAQLKACGGAGQPVATLGSAASEWLLRLTCERGTAGAPTWTFRYAGGADGSVRRTATVGSTGEVDGWLQRVATLVAGKRPIRLK